MSTLSVKYPGCPDVILTVSYTAVTTLIFRRRNVKPFPVALNKSEVAPNKTVHKNGLIVFCFEECPYFWRQQ